MKKTIFFLAAISFFICNLCYGIPKLNTKSYISFERNTKNVLFGENINKKVPMASTTKIMTAILTIEYGKMNEITTASKKAQNTNGQQLKLIEGDRISVNDLLYAIMLYSANDGAVVLAEHIGGDVNSFCDLMTNKAKQIGAHNTNFTSPHGLDDINHYSTPYDIALIMDYALNLPLFRQVISRPNYTIRINNVEKNINNTNKLLSTMDNIIGGKTGYTGLAGYCLACNYKNNELDIISVVLAEPSSKNRFEETKSIIEYSKDNYEIINLNYYLKEKIDIYVNKTFENIITIKPKRIDKICILKNKKDKISVKYSILDNLQAPIFTNDILCIGTVFLEGNELVKIEYYVDKDIKKNNLDDYFTYILTNLANILKIG